MVEFSDDPEEIICGEMDRGDAGERVINALRKHGYEIVRSAGGMITVPENDLRHVWVIAERNEYAPAISRIGALLKAR